jgi:hypothetical protein
MNNTNRNVDNYSSELILVNCKIPGTQMGPKLRQNGSLRQNGPTEILAENFQYWTKIWFPRRWHLVSLLGHVKTKGPRGRTQTRCTVEPACDPLINQHKEIRGCTRTSWIVEPTCRSQFILHEFALFRGQTNGAFGYHVALCLIRSWLDSE